MTSTTIFVSAVSSEFAPERQAIARRLRWDGWTPIYHDELRHGRPSLLRDLEAQITPCHAAVFLAGSRSGGGFPKPDEATGHAALLPPGLPRASYTQWEYLLAGRHDIRGLLYRTTDTYRPPEPPAPAHQQDDPALQAAFLDWLTRTGKFRFYFNDLPDLLADLRRELGQAPQVPRQRTTPGLLASIGDRFIGRDSLIDDLQRDLRAGHRAVITAAISGMSGVGKTRAAVEFARARRWDYPTALLLIQAGSPEVLETNFAELVTPLGLAADTPEARTEAVIDFLGRHPDWLLILDNVDSDEAMHAAHTLADRLGGGHILITSRLGTVPQGFTGLKLEVLSPEAATEFLLRATPGRAAGPDDAAQARALGEALGHLALALTHAAAYIQRLGLTFAAYRAELATAFERVMDFVGKEVSDYQRSTLATLTLTLERVTPAGLALLERLAFLADEPVPRFLLEVAVPGAERRSRWVPRWLGRWFRRRPDRSAEDLREAEADLAGYSLVMRNMEAGTFTTHRLVRELVRRRLTPEAARTRLEQALRWVNAAFEGQPDDVRTWPRLLPLAEHAEVVALAAEQAGIDEPTGRLMGQLDMLFDARAQYGRAERMSRAALAIGERSLGPDHPTVAARLNNLAELLRATNRLSEAEPLYRRVVTIFEAVPAPGHPNMGGALNNLAELLRATNRLSEAEPLYRRALAIDEASYGPDHPEVATDLNNLAGLLRATNRLSEAEPLYRRALAIDEASLGPDHPNVAIRLNNLAELLYATNRLSEAEPLYRRALAIFEASLGPDHPQVAGGLNNLANLLLATNRLSEAEPLSRRHLLIFLKFQRDTGHAHPHRDAAIGNHAGILEALGRTEAEIIAELRALLAEVGLEGL